MIPSMSVVRYRIRKENITSAAAQYRQVSIDENTMGHQDEVFI